MESREILLPAAIARHEQEEEIVANATTFKYDAAREEVGLGSIRPDIMITRGDRELLVEIAVTHFCDHEKIAKLRARGLPAIEIDLSSVPRLAGHEQHVEQILSVAPRAWLHNAKISAAEERLRREADRRETEYFRRRSASWRAGAKKRAEAVSKPLEERTFGPTQEAQRRQQYLRMEALHAFGDKPRADHWIRTKHTSLGKPPIEACLTSTGMDGCIRLLASVSHGESRFQPGPRNPRRL
jgi:hypothetical protein